MRVRAKRRAAWQVGWRVTAWLAIAYLVPTTAGWIGWTLPFDFTLNVAPAVEAPEFRLEEGDAGGPSQVVLLHGILRTNWSMARMERTLEAHGHDVLNFDYPSTNKPIQAHGADLARAIEARWGDAARQHGICIVGHSMGGMVAAAWMRRPDAVPVRRAVFLGVPHKGAMLADLRTHWWLFQLVMGTRAGPQLSPGAPLHREVTPYPDSVGLIAGGLGDGEGWHGSIPGDDDGTVAVVEALSPMRHPDPEVRRFPVDPASVDPAPVDPAEADRNQLAPLPDGWHRLVLPMGHTRLTFGDSVLRAVLGFLRNGRFP